MGGEPIINRPDFYYHDEPLAARLAGFLLAIVTCSACASFLCPSSSPDILGMC